MNGLLLFYFHSITYVPSWYNFSVFQTYFSDESSPQGMPPPPSGIPPPGFPSLYSTQQGRLPPTSQTSNNPPPNTLYFDKNHNIRHHNQSSEYSPLYSAPVKEDPCSPYAPGNKDPPYKEDPCSPYSPGNKDSPYSPVNKEDIPPYSAPYSYYSSSKISLGSDL